MGKIKKIIELKYIFNFILFLWILFIPFKDAIYQISIALLVLYFLLYVGINKDFKFLKDLFYKYKDLILAICLIFLSMTISNLINNISYIDGWITQLEFIYKYIFLFFILIYFYSKNFFSKKLLLIAILISLSFQILDGIYQAIVGIDLFKDRLGSLSRGLTGVTFNRNIFGMLMGLLTILLFMIFDKKNFFSTKNLFVSIFLICSIFCVLFSFTRSAWVSLFVVFLIYIFFNIKRINLKQVLVFLVFFTILILVFNNIELLNKRFVQLIQGYSAGRFEIWQSSIDLILEKPFFGWGLDSWKIYGPSSTKALHNSILEIIFCLGLFGIIVFSYLINLILKTLYINKLFNLFIICIFFFVFSQFEQSITRSTTLLSILSILMFYIFSLRIKQE